MISTQEPIVRAVLAPPDYAQRIEYLERKVESMRVWGIAMAVGFAMLLAPLCVVVFFIGHDLGEHLTSQAAAEQVQSAQE
jgi:hypothetical protein